MKRFCTRAAIAASMTLGGWAALMPAVAAPPTVTPSPGYDARLQQSRAAPPVYAPLAPDPKPAPHRRTKRTHPH